MLLDSDRNTLTVDNAGGAAHEHKTTLHIVHSRGYGASVI